MNRGELRDLFTEQMIRAVESRGFVDELFKMLDEIKDPDKRLGRGLELLKFVMPQLASQKIEVVGDEAQVTRVVFAPTVLPKPIELKP